MAIENLAQLKEDIRYVIKFGLINEAFLLIKILKKELKENADFASDTENYKFLYQLSWIVLPKLTDGDVIDLFTNHFMLFFELTDFDLWETFKSKLINLELEDRDDFKKKIKKILEENKEKITNQKIIVNDNISLPTVANWIMDYNIHIGGDKFSSSEKRNEYLSYNENIKQTSKEERMRLRILFDFYDRLSISSLTREGYEELLLINEGGVKGFMLNGIYVKIDNKTVDRIKAMQKIIDGISLAQDQSTDLKTNMFDNSQQLEALMKKYKVGSLERRAIEEELNRKAK